MKNKERITFAVCCNATGCHILPPFFIGNSVVPVCFADATPEEHSLYKAQSNAWMVRFLFEHWLTLVWYPAISARSSGPWVLLLDNCSAHGKLVRLAGVTFVFLPAKVTSLNQPLDSCFICSNKRNARTEMLRQTMAAVPHRQARLQEAANCKRGASGLAYGKLPHVLDAIRLINYAVGCVTKVQAARYWLSAEVLSLAQSALVRAEVGLPEGESGDSGAAPPLGDYPWLSDAVMIPLAPAPGIEGLSMHEGGGLAPTSAVATTVLTTDGVYSAGGAASALRGAEAAGTATMHMAVIALDDPAADTTVDDTPGGASEDMAALLSDIPGAPLDAEPSGGGDDDAPGAEDILVEGDDDFILSSGRLQTLAARVDCAGRVHNWLAHVRDGERKSTEAAALRETEYYFAVNELL